MRRSQPSSMTAVQSPLSPAFALSELDYPLFPSTSSYSPELARLHALRNKDAASRCKQPKRIFTLGTRNSKLAMVQTNIVKAALEERWPGIEFRIYGMVSPCARARAALGPPRFSELTLSSAARPPPATTTRRPRCTSLAAR